MCYHIIYLYNCKRNCDKKIRTSQFASIKFQLNRQNFNKAAEQVKTLTKRPTDDELLKLYAMFKQGSIGDNNTSTHINDHFFIKCFEFNFFFVKGKPGILDLKGKAKWNAWNNLKGTSQDTAKQDYVDFVNELLAQYE